MPFAFGSLYESDIKLIRLEQVSTLHSRSTSKLSYYLTLKSISFPPESRQKLVRQVARVLILPLIFFELITAPTNPSSFYSKILMLVPFKCYDVISSNQQQQLRLLTFPGSHLCLVRKCLACRGGSYELLCSQSAQADFIVATSHRVGVKSSTPSSMNPGIWVGIPQTSNSIEGEGRGEPYFMIFAAYVSWSKLKSYHIWTCPSFFECDSSCRLAVRPQPTCQQIRADL